MLLLKRRESLKLTQSQDHHFIKTSASFVISLDGVDEIVNFGGTAALRNSASFLLGYLLLLSTELVEEVREETEDAHMHGFHILDGIPI